MTQTEELEDLERRAQSHYDLSIRSTLDPQDRGKYLAIDVETGEYAIDSNDDDATDQLLTRLPNANIWLMRIGFPTTYRIGRM